jgi:hypothetical protein
MEYEESTGNVVASLNAAGGTSTHGEQRKRGGAGTVYLKKTGESVYGTLTVDNLGQTGQATVLPSLGSGTAQSGSSGPSLITGLTQNIPAYFAGHWIELRSSSGEFKGIYRVVSVEGTTATLEQEASASPGDIWRGRYRFDSVTVRNGAVLSGDDLAAAFVTGLQVHPASLVPGQAATGTVTLDAPAGPAGTVVNLDSSNPAVIAVTPNVTVPSGASSVAFQATAAAPGEASITATLGLSSRSASVMVVGVSSLTVDPQTVIAGTSSTATVTLTHPAIAGGLNVSMTSSHPAVAAVPATVAIAEGQSSAVFAVTAVSAGTSDVVAALGTSTKTAGLTVVTPALSSVSVSPSTLVIGSGGAGTVTLTHPALAGGHTVSLSTPDGRLQVPGTVTVPEGESAVTFGVSVVAESQPGQAVLNAAANGVTKSTTVEVIAPAAAVDGADLAEGNAARWSVFAADGAPASVTEDTLRVKVGSQSLKFVASSTGDTGVRYSVPPGTSLDLRQQLFLSFWEFAEASSPFTGPQPVVILRGPTGSFEYEPPAAQMTLGAWRRYVVPLSDASAFTRSEDGAPVLLDIREIEIRHRSSGGGGFTIYFDGVTFTSHLAGELSEGNAESWTAFAGDGAAASVTSDTSHVRIGETALEFSTESGNGTGVRYPSSEHRPKWNLSGVQSLYFYLWANSQSLFQGNQPVVRLIGPSGALRYEPSGVLTIIGSWRFVEVPLAGGDGWTLTNEGSVSLAEINQLEITGDALEPGFTLYMDGVGFGQRVPMIAAVPHTVRQGQQAAIRIDLAEPAPAGGRVLSLVSSDTSVLPIPAPATVPEGQTSISVPVTAGNVTAEKIVTISWDDAGVPRETHLTVRANVAPVVTASVVPDSTIQPGASFVVSFTASDDVKLSSVDLAVSGAFTAARSMPASSASSSGSFDPLPVPANAEGTISIQVSATDEEGARGSAPLLTLTVPLPDIQSVDIPSGLDAGSSGTGMVTLSRPTAAGASIQLSSSDTGVATVPSTVSVPPGQSSGQFEVQGISEGTATITATLGSSSKTAAVTVLGPRVASVSVTPAHLVIGSTVTGHVTLTIPALSGGYNVGLSSAGGVLQIPASVTIPAGELSVSFPVSAAPGSVPGSVNLEATADGVTRTFGVQLVNSQEPAEGIDLTEGNASEWQAFAEDSATTNLSDEAVLVRSGSTSLKFVTQSTSNTGIRYRVPADGNWNLRTRRFLSFWEYAENSGAFDGPQPVVVLRGPGGSFQYEPPGAWMTPGRWRRYIVPLSDLSAYTRSEDGAPLLLDITEIEIRHRSAGSVGFTIYFDGITFTSVLQGELTEGNAELWESFAEDSAATVITNDSDQTRIGAQALKFVTQSGFGTGLRYPASADRPRWNLSTTQSLYFYLYALNTNDLGFQGDQPVVKLIGPDGFYQYTPSGTLTPIQAWRFFEVPLEGGDGWTRTEAGSVSLSEINQIEVWNDTWGGGFTLYVDGVSCGQRLPLLTVHPSVLSIGQSADVRILLAQPAPVGGRVLNITVSNPDALQLPAVVTVPQGETSVTFPVTARELGGGQDVALTWNDDGALRESWITILDNPVPVVSAQTVPSGAVAQGSAFTVSFEAADDDEIRTVDLEVTGAMTASQSRSVASTLVSGSFDPITVPAGVTGQVTVRVSAVDSRGARGFASPITLQAAQYVPVVTVTPGVLQAGPGESIPVTVEAQSPTGITRIRVQATGAFVYSRLLTVSETGVSPVSRTVSIPVPTGNVAGSVSVTATAYDTSLVASQSNPAEVNIADTVKPAIWSFERGSNGPVRSGRETQLIVQAADAGGVKSVRFTAGLPGAETSVEVMEPFLASAYSGTLSVPEVPARQDVPVTIRVEDNAGNIETLVASIDVVPVTHPAVEIVSPSASIVPVLPGGRIDLIYRVPADQAATRVDWSLNAVSVHSSEDAGAHATSIAIPATGDSWTLEARVGGVLVTARTLQAVSGHVLSEGTISATDGTHENQTVVIAGEVAIEGHHSFANLLVLHGASGSGRLIAGSNPTVPGEVILDVAGLVYVAGGTEVDSSGRGYLGGYSGVNLNPSGLTIGAVPGGSPMAGGSAGGLGGSASGNAMPAPAYGSVKKPLFAGSGGGADGWSRPGGPGGGAIRIATGPSGQIVVDGGINANGWGSTSGGGGGGSIFISAPKVSGVGAIQAGGGQVEYNSRGGSGGGGRIALESPTDLTRMLLAVPSGPHDFADGGAGTIFLKAPGDRHGHFFTNNGWTRRDGKTVLPSIGSGSMTFVAGRSFRGSNTSWMPGIEDSYVDVTRGSDFIGRFSVSSFDRSTQTITLDPEAESQLIVGDAYQGVQLFDSIQVDSRAHVETTDRIDEARIRISPGSSLHSAGQTVQPLGEPPTITASISALEARPGETLTLTVTCADAEGLQTLLVFTDGTVVPPSPAEIPLNGARTDSRNITLQIPAGIQGGEAFIRVAVVDTDGHDVYVTPLRVTVAASLPPVIATVSVCPAASPQVVQGSRITVCIDAASEAGIGAHALEIRGSFGWSAYESQTSCFELDIPPDATPGVAIATGIVRDTLNRETRGSISFAVHADNRVPVIADVSPRDRSLVPSGSSLLLSLDAWDDGRIQVAEAWLDGQQYELQQTSANHWEASVPAPSVDVLTEKQLVMRVWDAANRTVERASALLVYPAAAPAIRFLAPSVGALAAPGLPLPVRVEATSTANITRVELFSGSSLEPFQTFAAGGPLYQTAFTVDPAAVEGSTVTIRAKVTDDRGISTETESSVAVITGEVVTADRTIAPEEPLANDTLILAAGTCTLSGTRSLARLLVLDGATLTHPAWTAGSGDSGLNLTVGDMYVARGGRVDASGRGYPGGLSGGSPDIRGISFNGVHATPATSAGTGGSHGGRGAGLDGSDGPAPFGRFIEPVTLGGGGGARSDGSAPGGTGGGHLWLATNYLTLDGEILANGQPSPAPGTGAGAGGSVRISTYSAEVRGWGKVEASGGAGLDGGMPGGGGRVHLTWGAWEFKNATASGGSGAAVYGGAGSIHRGAGREFVDFVGRNLTRENARTAASGVAPIGNGAIATVEGTWISRSTGTWRKDQELGFLAVRRGPDTIGTFEIQEVDSVSGRVRLSDEALGLIQPGDTFQGVHKAGSLTVAGGVRFESSDMVEVDSGQADAASTFDSLGISIQNPPLHDCAPAPATVSFPSVNSRKTLVSPRQAGSRARRSAAWPIGTWYPGQRRPDQECHP